MILDVFLTWKTDFSMKIDAEKYENFVLDK
jgi:hypothetical protein